MNDSASGMLSARRAIESLRSGVPSGAAVRALGWNDPSHIRRFESLLERAANDADSDRGLLVQGEFGTGKSHLLGYLEQLALNANFVVSRVVISKETPLFQPERVLASALRDGKVPGARGAVLHELGPRLDFRSSNADSLVRWAAQAPGMLGGSIRLLERTVELGDDELIARVIDWWSGEKIGVTEIKKALKTLGEAQAFDVRPIRVADLTPLRIALTSHVIRAAGFSGWLVLLDEIELVGRYSKLQRAKSYAQLAQWFGRSGPLGTSMACVCTVTDDFGTKVLDGGADGLDDRDGIPEWLRQRGRPGDPELAELAGRGIAVLDDPNPIYLAGPDTETLRQTHERVASVYAQAFEWQPPIEEPRSLGLTTPMRTYIKTWIYGWDLSRLQVTERPEIQAEALAQSYEEDAALEEDAVASGDDE